MSDDILKMFNRFGVFLNLFLIFFCLVFPSSVADNKSVVGYVRNDGLKGDEIQITNKLSTFYKGLNVEICGYTLHHDDRKLFHVDHVAKNGDVKLTLNKNLHYELSHHKKSKDSKNTGNAKKPGNSLKAIFDIELAPYDCESGRHLEKTQLSVKVVGPYKWKPKLPETDLVFQVTEDQSDELIGEIPVTNIDEGMDVHNKKDNEGLNIHEDINSIEQRLALSVSVGEDHTPNKICEFKIISSGKDEDEGGDDSVPFTVDNNGHLKRTQTLKHQKKARWVFWVTGTSCDGHVISNKVKVIVTVMPPCRPKWAKVPQKLIYSWHNKALPLFPAVELDLCQKSCNVTSASVTVTLSTEHIGKGCDRDTYSINSLRKLCGATSPSLDLLPSPTLPQSWTTHLPHDDGKEGDEVFSFDGEHHYAQIPDEVKLGRQFSLSAWLKHDDASTNDDDRLHGGVHKKEQIVCLSDAQVKNRQHMSLYIHKCHLVFLLRRKPEFGLDKDTQVPATWRWYLPSLCDAKWHHYSVSVIDDEEEEENEKDVGGGDHKGVDRIISSEDSSSSRGGDGEVFNSLDNQVDDDGEYLIRVKRGRKINNNNNNVIKNNNDEDDKVDEKKVSEEYLKFAKMFGKITASSSSSSLPPSSSSSSSSSFPSSTIQLKAATKIKKDSKNRINNRKYNPRIDLYVDGKLFLEKPQSVVTDFPLHDVRKVQSTKMLVGACWMGSTNTTNHHYGGYMAGVALVNGGVEKKKTINCVNQCHEGIVTDEKRQDTSDNIKLMSHNLASLQAQLRHISYFNSRNFPTLGHRPIIINTHLMCNKKSIIVEESKSLLLIDKVEKPIITLKSETSLDVEVDQLKDGIKLLKSLDIIVHPRNQEDEVVMGAGGEKPSFMEKYKLDECSVLVQGSLLSPDEEIIAPKELITELNMDLKTNKKGFIIGGVDKISNFEKVLKETTYTHHKADSINVRRFSISCSELNGRFISNNLKVKLAVTHKQQKQQEAQAALSNQMALMDRLQPIIERLSPSKTQKHHAAAATNVAGSATGLVVVSVVCVGFIFLLATLGFTRIRNAQKHSQDGAGLDDKQEMEWDNSALTITVNPMQGYDEDASLVGSDEKLGRSFYSNDDAINNNNSMSLSLTRHVDDTDEEEEEDDDEKMKDGGKRHELEWDDSILSY